MTALVLPRRSLWVPRFEPWRLLRPLMNLNGNNIEYGDIGSPMGASMQAMEAGDDGDEAGGIAVTYTNSYSTTGSSNPFSISSVDIGPASSDRVVYIGARLRNPHNVYPTVSSATINAVSATILKTHGGFHSGIGILAAAVPTGTSVTVEVSWTDAYQRCDIDVFYATGLSAGTTALQTASSAAGTTSTASANLSSLTVGDLVLTCAGGYESTGPDYAINSTPSLTIGALDTTYGGAYAGVAAATSYTLNISGTSTGNSEKTICSASVR